MRSMVLLISDFISSKKLVVSYRTGEASAAIFWRLEDAAGLLRTGDGDGTTTGELLVAGEEISASAVLLLLVRLVFLATTGLGDDGAFRVLAAGALRFARAFELAPLALGAAFFAFFVAAFCFTGAGESSSFSLSTLTALSCHQGLGDWRARALRRGMFSIFELEVERTSTELKAEDK